ncbi:GntR family transcriptional regulator [Psychromarinibacter sp. C21-152]|uniref:GntR family transcriptional regulator n=1 Tax=Psychromarinibacter sediminicola TaxID=3033385 RepID=A0AAE3NRX3_9RHOB|nr:GntR family transcriptional regulator [Psychromarinibacter sediminicola]MDF0599417.1 GntR family transcriptional regulator [Psychromarinibacter sediminicola]
MGKIPSPRSLTDLVTERLRGDIVDGVFTFGESVSEDRLAAAYGVSRTPVRDALSALQFEGLVEVRPKRGSFVFDPTADDIAELCAYREMLEREAIRMSVVASRGALCDRLDAIVRNMEAELERKDFQSYAHSDTAFHRAFFEYCGNRLVTTAFDLAEARIATVRTALTSPYVERRDASFEEHYQIARELRQGEIDAALALLADHIDRTRIVAVAGIG